MALGRALAQHFDAEHFGRATVRSRASSLCALGECWPSVGPDRRFFFLMNSAAAVAAAPEQVWGRFANGAISNSIVMSGGIVLFIHWGRESTGARRRRFRFYGSRAAMALGRGSASPTPARNGMEIDMLPPVGLAAML